MRPVPFRFGLISSDANKTTIEAAALASDAAKKIIIVPGWLVNIVV
ncbi:MAG: hypothetical protein LBO00_00870 [Zoogloeaceae bacterium]|jgi:hypothetical protein|nr:hypothetical protein [Zoogloeaceae bacterium]